MGGGKGGGDSEAKAARKAEEKRQADIRAGTTRINEIFNGQTVGDQKLAAGAAYDPNAKYYNADGSVWTPTISPASAAAAAGARTSVKPVIKDTVNGGFSEDRQGGSAKNAAATVAKPAAPAGLSIAEQFAQRAGSLYSGTKQTSGFNDDYFAKQRQGYLDYATPQLEDQYGTAQKDLTFALARSGNLNSSARASKAGELQKSYDLNKQQIADSALSYEGQARNSVEDARSGLIATLNATGDATGAANAALARSTALSQPAAYSPLASLFSDFTSGLGTQAAEERAAAASNGTYKSRYNTGLFGNSGSSVVVK